MPQLTPVDHDPFAGAVYTGTAERLPPRQADRYRQMQAAGTLDTTAAPGSAQWPTAQRRGGPPGAPGSYWVDQQGLVNPPQLSPVDYDPFAPQPENLFGRINGQVRTLAQWAPGLDELDAATNATLAPVLQPLLQQLPTYEQEHHLTGDWKDRFSQSAAMQRDMDERYDAAHPRESIALQLGGGVAGAVAGGQVLAPFTRTLAPGAGGGVRVATGAGDGAAFGLAAGYANGTDGFTDPSRLQGAGWGALGGAAGGAAFPVAGNVIKAGWNSTGRKLTDALRGKVDVGAVPAEGVLAPQPMAPPRRAQLSPQLDLQTLTAEYAKHGVDLRPEQGKFGPILHGLKGNWTETVAALSRLQDGEVPAALYHPDVGEIDAIWAVGDRGLKWIAAAHPEVLASLPDRIARTQVLTRSANRIRLVAPDTKAVIRLDLDGQSKKWLMTAYEPGVGRGSGTTGSAPGSLGQAAKSPNRPGENVAPSAPPKKPDPRGGRNQ